MMRMCYIPRQRLYGGMMVFLLLLLAFWSLQGWLTSKEGFASEKGNQPIFQGVTGGKNVAVTINVDWGEEFLPAMLQILAEQDVQATFFVTASWAEKHPELVQQMASAGHSVQSHGYKHDHYNQLTVQQAVEELKKAEQIISGITKKSCVAFASPYGEFEDSIVQAATQCGYHLIMWTVDSIDWQKPAPNLIVQRVLDKIQNDAILLFHPTEPTLQALPEILTALQEQGYQTMTIEEILQLPSPEPSQNTDSKAVKS